MQIASISSIAPISSLTTSSRPVATLVSKSTSATTSAAPVASTKPAIAAPSTAPASRPAVHSGGGASSASAVQETLAAVYSTTVSGKSYSGSVVESNGEYTATIANMPGASASGSSIESAENSLGLVLDTLV
jgi:hypothetical protein